MILTCVNSLNLHVDFSHEEDKQRRVSFPLPMFEELTVEPSSFVYLISRLCWRKPKWKWHHFQRICNSSELKTTRPAKHVILSLWGWVRHPQEQTGLGFVFAWACVCVCLSECASGGVRQQKAPSSRPDEEGKWVLFPLSMLLFLFFLSRPECTYLCLCELACALLLVCVCFCLCLYGCVCVCVSHKISCSAPLFLWL